MLQALFPCFFSSFSSINHNFIIVFVARALTQSTNLGSDVSTSLYGDGYESNNVKLQITADEPAKYSIAITRKTSNSKDKSRKESKIHHDGSVNISEKTAEEKQLTAETLAAYIENSASLAENDNKDQGNSKEMNEKTTVQNNNDTTTRNKTNSSKFFNGNQKSVAATSEVDFREVNTRLENSKVQQSRSIETKIQSFSVTKTKTNDVPQNENDHFDKNPRPAFELCTQMTTPEIFHGNFLLKNYGKDKVACKPLRRSSRVQSYDGDQIHNRNLPQADKSDNLSVDSMHMFTQVENQSHKELGEVDNSTNMEKSRAKKNDKSKTSLCKNPDEVEAKKPRTRSKQRTKAMKVAEIVEKTPKLTRLKRLLDTDHSYKQDFDEEKTTNKVGDSENIKTYSNEPEKAQKSRNIKMNKGNKIDKLDKSSSIISQKEFEKTSNQMENINLVPTNDNETTKPSSANCKTTKKSPVITSVEMGVITTTNSDQIGKVGEITDKNPNSNDCCKETTDEIVPENAVKAAKNDEKKSQNEDSSHNSSARGSKNTSNVTKNKLQKDSESVRTKKTSPEIKNDAVQTQLFKHPDEVSQEGTQEKIGRWLDKNPDSVSPLLSAEAINAKLRAHQEMHRVWERLDDASQECQFGDGVIVTSSLDENQELMGSNLETSTRNDRGSKKDLVEVVGSNLETSTRNDRGSKKDLLVAAEIDSQGVSNTAQNQKDDISEIRTIGKIQAHTDNSDSELVKASDANIRDTTLKVEAILNDDDCLLVESVNCMESQSPLDNGNSEKQKSEGRKSQVIGKATSEGQGNIQNEFVSEEIDCIPDTIEDTTTGANVPPPKDASNQVNYKSLFLKCFLKIKYRFL